MPIQILASGAEWARIGESYFWPGGAILLSLLVFRQPIAEFIRKMKWFKASTGGIEGGTKPPDQGSPPPPPTGSPPPPAQSPTSPAVETTDVEQIRPFVYYWFYEKMYRLLFGTQTEALRYASTQPTGASRSNIEKLFEEHERRVKKAEIDQEANWNTWIGFMTNSGLLGVEGDIYQITPLGKALLQWMTAENLGDSPLL